ncbi:hypothetical protein N836_08860 [Leptolyngbya sp. Heron Island J]|nr:hypothetical protein [Leptolyngbya sp. Heron Island J]ESA36080.1 hypothetical protein N836_08860 [Leptolyngbya sp. Heron Island J]
MAQEQAQIQIITAAQNPLDTGMPKAQIISILNLTAEQAQQLG